jgi:hypothetical protein
LLPFFLFPCVFLPCRFLPQSLTRVEIPAPCCQRPEDTLLCRRGSCTRWQPSFFRWLHPEFSGWNPPHPTPPPHQELLRHFQAT